MKKYYYLPNKYTYICINYFDMVKQIDEISVFFSIPEDILVEFNKACEIKSKELGITLNKKQAYNLALKEITELWKKEKPG